MPIGLSIAEKIGVSPYPIAMIITLAGAASYATPLCRSPEYDDGRLDKINSWIL